MAGEQQGVHGIEQFVCVACETYVVLLVHGLKLRVEASDYHVLEAVCLYPRPVLHLVGRYVLNVAGHVVARVGVGSLRSD